VTQPPRYLSIAAYCEDCLDRYGDHHRGVAWPKAEDVDTRYQVMLDVIRPGARRPVRLLDFGCGASHLLEYIRRRSIPGIAYSGLDVSERFIDLSRAKFPGVPYWCLDVLTVPPEALPRFDYAVINGVFTCKAGLSFDDMWDFFTRAVERVFSLTDVGIAFNVMSKCVDWERDDLFHVPFDRLAGWLTKNVSRHFAFRHEYGLYEYTTYVYRDPVARPEGATGS
jgi:SAM-dependent methyltransferase